MTKTHQLKFIALSASEAGSLSKSLAGFKKLVCKKTVTLLQYQETLCWILSRSSLLSIRLSKSARLQKNTDTEKNQ